MPNLSWEDVAKIVRLGHSIGSHTMTHPDLGQIGPAEAHAELADSKRILEDRVQQPIRWFAYPYGGRGNFRPAYLQLASDIGYDACFSGYGGFVQPYMLGQVLPRENVTFFRSLMNLELHLTGCLDWFYQVKRSVGIV
jgi:peptidoglycan/xylan/chitin deacetylase (PgdA/CDA1 family)